MSDMISAIMNEDGLSVSTAKKAYNALNEFLKYAVHKRIMEMKAKIAEIEQSTKSAHKRLDDLMKG